MLLVIMVLGVLLIPKIPEKWFRFLFLACIVMNAIYRMELFPSELGKGMHLFCKVLELILLIAAFQVFDKRPLSFGIGVLSILFFGGMSAIYSAYGTSGKGVAEGIRLIESVKTLCLSLVYLSLDVRIFLRIKRKDMKE